MKREINKYLYAVENTPPDKRKTKMFTVYSKSGNDVLGWIQWYGPWRQYNFYPAPDCGFNSGCLAGLAHFLNAIRDERREED